MIVIPPQSSAWPWGDSGQSRCLGGWYHQFKSKSSGHLWFWYVLMASRHHIFRDPPIPNFRLGLQPVDLAGGRWENVSSQESFICVLNVANMVGGRNPAPVEEFLSHYLYGFNHPRWCRISSILSMKNVKSIWHIFMKKMQMVKQNPCPNRFGGRIWSVVPVTLGYRPSYPNLLGLDNHGCTML
jgi:hypothetical protein